MQTIEDLMTPAASCSRRRGPSLAQLTYAKELMTVALLGLTFLWLVPRLLRAPGATLEGLGKRVAGRV